MNGAWFHSPARDAAYAAIRAHAMRTGRRAVKERARDYLSEPWQLDTLGARPGFTASMFTADELIEFAKELLRQEMAAPINLPLVPVRRINAKAAIIAGRYMRAKANKIARRAA